MAYIVHGLRGSLYNTTEFCRRLIDSGHEVTVLSFRDVRIDVEASGADFVRLTAGPQAEAELRTTVARTGRLRSLSTARRLRNALVVSTEVRVTVERLAPDLLMIDAEMHAAIIATAQLHIPTMAVLPFFSLFREPGVPPANCTRYPSSGLRQRIGIDYEWASLFGRRAASRTIGQFTLRAMRQRLMPFHLNSPAMVNIRAVAAAHEFDLAAATTWRQWLHPHIYHDLPILSYTCAELDFARNPPANFHYVGPMINQDRLEPLLTSRDEARWHDFRDRAAGAGQRLLYASMGSLQPASVDYYRHILDVFARRPEWAVVLGLGSQGDPNMLGHTPDNALLLSYAPQLDVLQHADVALHSGGIGTMNECIHHEVPSIVCSTMPVEQPGNVARLQFFDLGLAISLDDMSPDTIEAAIEQLLDRPQTRAALREKKMVMDRYANDHVGVKVVERFLAQSTQA